MRNRTGFTAWFVPADRTSTEPNQAEGAVRFLSWVGQEKRQINHTTGLALCLCPCLRRFSITKPQIVMIKLSIAALANAR